MQGKGTRYFYTILGIILQNPKRSNINQCSAFIGIREEMEVKLHSTSDKIFQIAMNEVRSIVQHSNCILNMQTASYVN
jgi:hypothetical protein